MTTRSTIADLPRTERPRERLLDLGARALTDTELVAVLLRTGTRGKSALAMAREILVQAGGLSGLVGIQPRDLVRDGLRDAKAATVLAALELARRFAEDRMEERPLLARPAAVASYLTLRYRDQDQEVMGAIFLDGRNGRIHDKEIFRGTLSRAAVSPREILKEAMARGAAGVLLFHTHPSGDPAPSAEDLAFTRRMAEAGELVGVRLVDHMILGGTGRWVSLRERGAW